MTTIIERLSKAWGYFRAGWSGHPPERKGAPYIWPSWREGVPTWQMVDFDSYTSDGYDANALIYATIMYKARAMASVPLRAYTGTPTDSEELPPSHPLASLCLRPNPRQSYPVFATLCSVYLNLSGNCYIWVDRRGAADNGGAPTAMYVMRPDRVRIIPRPRRSGRATRDDVIVGYLYVPEGASIQDGIPLLPGDVMHVRLPNPSDPLDGFGEGLSPIAPLARSGDVDNQITRYLHEFFKRGAMPMSMLSYDIPLSEADVGLVKEQFMRLHGSADKWLEPLVAGQGAHYERLSMTFSEMGFESLDERNESRILGPFGVPQILIGTRLGLRSATFANYELARQAFWEDTMTWELALFETEFQYYLRGSDDAFVALDYTDVPGLKQDIVKMAQIANAAWQAGAITRNEYRLRIGMDYVDDGDVYLVNPMSLLVPVGAKPEMMWLPPGPRSTPPDTMEGAPSAAEEQPTAEEA